MTAFPKLNRAYEAVFQWQKLSVGLVVPLERYATSAVPKLERHLQRARLAEDLGFSAIWLRDVPFHVPSFGDAGQVLDPFVYLGALATATERIALGVASVVLPLRHPAHVAKAAASVDVLSEGRLLLGVASGDRPEEYPALEHCFEDRSARFRDAMEYVRAMAEERPVLSNAYGSLAGNIDLLPKPTATRLPLLITGSSQQSPDWVAQHGDGWLTYPRAVASQGRVVAEYRRRLEEAGGGNKPVAQSLYVDVLDDPHAEPHPIHLGFRSGVGFLRQHLRDLKELGVNHVALNLRFNAADIEATLRRLARELLPEFTN